MKQEGEKQIAKTDKMLAGDLNHQKNRKTVYIEINYKIWIWSEYGNFTIK